MKLAFVALTASLMMSGAAHSQEREAPEAEDPQIAKLVAQADALADEEKNKVINTRFVVERYCHPEPTSGQTRVWASQILPATSAFDNLHYVGHTRYGYWVVETSEGLILLDGGDSAEDVRNYIEPGLTSLGLDPNDLKYVVIMHGHADHWGGAKYLQDTYSPTVVLGAGDWDMLEDEDPNGSRGAPPTRDFELTGDYDLVLGDTTVHLVSTPGHTPDGYSAFVEVRDGEETHMVSMWGGTSIPRDAEGVAQYSESLKRFTEMSDELNAEVLISNHPYVGTAQNGIMMLGYREEGEPNPFVVGEEAVLRYYKALDLCMQAAHLRALAEK